MKKQSLADKLNESLGMRRGKESTKKQSYASRRNESKGASGADHHHKEAKRHLKEHMKHMGMLHKMAKSKMK